MIIKTKKDLCIMLQEILEISPSLEIKQLIGEAKDVKTAVRNVLFKIERLSVFGNSKLYEIYKKYEINIFKGKVSELNVLEMGILYSEENKRNSPNYSDFPDMVEHHFYNAKTDKYITRIRHDGLAIGFKCTELKHFNDAIIVNGKQYKLMGEHLSIFYNEYGARIRIVSCEEM